MKVHTTLNRELNLMDIHSYKTISDQFFMLGYANRLRIFTLLCHKEECVGHIARILSMSPSAVSSSLKLLKSVSLIKSRREGKEIYYKVNDSKKCQLLHYSLEKMMSLICPGQYAIDAKFLQENSNPINQEQKFYIENIHDDILENLGNRLSINHLASKYLISPSALKYQFKKVYGKSIAAHIKEHRMKKAEELLRESSLSIGAIAHQVGYSSSSKFSSSFKKNFGVLPSEYRNIHKM